MGRPKTDNDVAMSVRLPAEVRARLEALQPKLAPIQLTLSQVMRAALDAGLEELERKSKGRRT